MWNDSHTLHNTTSKRPIGIYRDYKSVTKNIKQSVSEHPIENLPTLSKYI